jgi:hypothetical protein
VIRYGLVQAGGGNLTDRWVQADEQLTDQLERLVKPDDDRRIEPEPLEALVLLRSGKWSDPLPSGERRA